MSVLEELQIVKREFRGFDDPSLPEGMWQGAVASLGNGSAGINAAALLFNQGTGVPRDPNFYSLDQISCIDTFNSAQVFSISIVGFGELGIAGYSYAFQGLVFNGTDNILPAPALAGFLPHWMGRQSAVSVSSNIQMVTPNINAATITFHARGYWWGPRSINAPGGPSRPLQGIF